MRFQNRKLNEYWQWLRSLNEGAQYSYIVTFPGEFNIDTGAIVQPDPFTVPSDKNFFAYQIGAYCELDPTANADFAATPEVRYPHMISVQINTDPPNVNMFSAPITLSHFMGGGSLSMCDRVPLPIPHRAQFQGTIECTFGIRVAPAATFRFGLALYGELIEQSVLSRAESIMANASSGARANVRRNARR